MKVKEKGLTGKAAQFRKDLITRRKFDAFKNMENEKKTNEGKKEVEKKDIYLEYLGTKLLITPDGKGVGTVKEEEIPFLKGATLKFEGAFDNVSFNALKVCRHDIAIGSFADGHASNPSGTFSKARLRSSSTSAATITVSSGSANL